MLVAVFMAMLARAMRLAFVLGVKFARQYDSWYTCVAGGYMMAAGGLLAMSYLCVRSGDAGEYNAYRPPGFETPQAPAG